jgi:hypothetical protein
MSLIVELNDFTNIFYLLKHLMLLNLTIFKIKCNNLIFNEILSLYVSLHRESSDLNYGRRISYFLCASITVMSLSVPRL